MTGMLIWWNGEVFDITRYADQEGVEDMPNNNCITVYLQSSLLWCHV